MLIRVFDFETTGLPTDDDPKAVVQVGYCDVLYSAGEAAIGGQRQMTVNPGRPIEPEASAVHHLTDTDVAGHPPPDAGMAFLMGGGFNRPDYFAAFNLDFDGRYFGGGEVPMFCIYKAALRVYPDAPGHSNQVLRYWLGLDLDRVRASPPHAAGADAYVSACLLARMLSDGLVEIDTMIRWSKGPALLPKVNFGKHKGAKWADVPTDYLKWIIEKSDFDRNVKANAKHHLKERGAWHGR